MKYLVLFFFIGFYGFSQNIRERKIKKIIDESIVLNRSHVSFSIQPVGQIGKSTRGFQTSKYMTPASNNKLLTFIELENYLTPFGKVSSKTLTSILEFPHDR